MESSEKTREKPLKRSFEEMSSTENEPMDVDDNLTPTDYQSRVFEVAMERNTIAVFETGVGKTKMAVMMIKEIGKSLKNDSTDKKIIVFLSPTVHIVRQQCKEIKLHVKLEVEEFYGTKGVDEWNADKWDREICKNDVLAMTPQILLDALRKAYLRFEMICFIVLDECHLATGKHPYAKIMKEFYHKCTNRPKIFGISTSPRITKGVSYEEDQRKMELEVLLDSHIYTAVNERELEEVVPNAKQEYRFYEPRLPSCMAIKETLESLGKKFDAVLLDMQRSTSENDDTHDKYKKLCDIMTNDQVEILFCLENLGSLCAYEGIKLCIENASKIQEDDNFLKRSVLEYEKYLLEMLSAIEESHKRDSMELLNDLNRWSDALDTGLISSKLHELLDIFRLFGKATGIICIVLVERIITAKVIEKVMKKISALSFLKISCLTANTSTVDGLSPEAPHNILEAPHSSEATVLFSMDLAHEDVHIPNCSYIIYFDLPRLIHNYVHSCGKAPLKDSQYIIMLERGNNKQIDLVSNLTRRDISVAHSAINRNPDSFMSTPHGTNAGVAYVVEMTGASVTADSSINLIQRYCEKLPRDKYFIPEPKFEFVMERNVYRCKLILPPSAAFETILGPEACGSDMSKQLVCLEACKKLHAMGNLNDNLLPLNEVSPKDSTTNVKVLTSKPGTTKRKELHGSVSIHLLSGTWVDKPTGATFHAYKMNFTCNIAEEKFSSFVLLLESKLDEDVGNVEVDLYLRSKFVKSSVSYFGCLELNSEQVNKAKCFQELIFNSLFGKMFIKSSSGEKIFLPNAEESLWDPSKNYLLLPLESKNEACQEYTIINWIGIDSCVSAVEFLNRNAWLNIRRSELTVNNSYMHNSVSTEPNNNVIHLANLSASISNLKGIVVFAIHTAKTYSILDVVANTSSASPFFEDSNASYSSFADYYKKKYNIFLKYPEQPLLLLKQGHNAHNLLVDFRNEGKHKLKGGSKTIVSKPQQHAYIPPELLVGTDIKTDVLKTVYLLPSLMHRMESLMLASQLREEIADQNVDLKISSSLILESITTRRCADRFSMERLELLGDSVLKYVVSCHLFLKYPKKHEGQLSNHRSGNVSNSTLHKLGVARNLQGFIRDCAFDPRQWTAPGQRSIWHSPCNHCVETREVPLDEKFTTEDSKVTIGEKCDRGHRWMLSKTISDFVEALIGAYYVDGGLIAAIHLMKWLGINSELEPSRITDAINAASLYSIVPQLGNLNILESKIGYEFKVKGLLLEAITHATAGVDYCYQRLEFLGDSVLDILITLHLYNNHKDIDPGDLTDLRSASVNNDQFALSAVKKNLEPHILFNSPYLEEQISSFLSTVSSMSTITLTPDIKAPKVLGDLVESIAGAILIDSRLNLDEVWRVFKPLLSPIVTPDKLELLPSRELIELCDSLGYFIKGNFCPKGELVDAELTLQLEDVLLIGKGSGPTRKSAKGMASLVLLKKLKARGISSSKHSIRTGFSTRLHSEIQRDQSNCESREKSSDSKKIDIPVIPPIDLKKGGPRISLFELCKKLQWPMPTFNSIEQKSRVLVQVGDAWGCNSFESTINLTIPEDCVIEVTGETRLDKKSSYDSAAVKLMYELERRGKIIISK